MRHLALTVTILFNSCLSAAPFAEGSILKLETEMVFTQERKWLNFLFKPDAVIDAPPDSPVQSSALHTPQLFGHPPRFFLLELDGAGKKIRQLGVINDEHFLGDKLKGDGIYTSKIPFQTLAPGTVYFSVVADPESIEELKVAPKVKLEVIRRPTFVELLKGAFNKIRARFS